jgi:hypothetical protein
MRVGILVIGIALLIAANVLAMMGFPGRHSMEGFTNYFLDGPRMQTLAHQMVSDGASTGSDYQPMSSFDGARVETGNGVSSWRYVAPAEKPTADFKLGPDSLFMFKNNQCKASCCPASMSCDGGCVCTTPEQRQFIATRGGNHNTDN